MPLADSDVISAERGGVPLRCCPAPLLPMRRSRFFWLDWKRRACSETRLEEKEGFVARRFVGQGLGVRDFLKGQETVMEGFDAFPCFMRAIPRSSPGLSPRGLTECDEEDLRRWAADMHRYAPYQYRRCCVIKDRRTGRLYPPKSSHREELMGFPRDHTYSCWKKHRAERKPCWT